MRTKKRGVKKKTHPNDKCSSDARPVFRKWFWTCSMEMFFACRIAKKLDGCEIRATFIMRFISSGILSVLGKKNRSRGVVFSTWGLSESRLRASIKAFRISYVILLFNCVAKVLGSSLFYYVTICAFFVEGNLIWSMYCADHTIEFKRCSRFN